MDPFGAQGSDQAQSQPQDGMSWWFKWLIKGAAVLLGFLALVLGIVTTISLSAYCMIGGLVLT